MAFLSASTSPLYNNCLPASNYCCLPGDNGCCDTALMAMGARIKAERGDTDQAVIAAKVPGLTQQALSNLETRDSRTSEFAPGIADALGVSLRWLMTGEGDKKSDWPFRRIQREQLTRLSDEDLLVVEGALLMAIHHLRPHKEGEFPPGVVVIPERRRASMRQVSKLPGKGATDQTTERRSSNGKSAKGG